MKTPPGHRELCVHCVLVQCSKDRWSKSARTLQVAGTLGMSTDTFGSVCQHSSFSSGVTSIHLAIQRRRSPRGAYCLWPREAVRTGKAWRTRDLAFKSSFSPVSLRSSIPSWSSIANISSSFRGPTSKIQLGSLGRFKLHLWARQLGSRPIFCWPEKG